MDEAPKLRENETFRRNKRRKKLKRLSGRKPRWSKMPNAVSGKLFLLLFYVYLMLFF